MMVKSGWRGIINIIKAFYLVTFLWLLSCAVLVLDPGFNFRLQSHRSMLIKSDSDASLVRMRGQSVHHVPIDLRICNGNIYFPPAFLVSITFPTLQNFTITAWLRLLCRPTAKGSNSKSPYFSKNVCSWVFLCVFFLVTNSIEASFFCLQMLQKCED